MIGKVSTRVGMDAAHILSYSGGAPSYFIQWWVFRMFHDYRVLS